MITVFSKKNCGKCESAKDKLNRLNIPYQEKSYEHHTTLHDGWRDDGSIMVMAARRYYGDTNIPVIEQDGKFFDYPGFMKKIKELGEGK